MSYVRLNKRKYHFIYKTTCSLTGRYYIGMHSTDNLDDGYLGSGRRLAYSIRKYGPKNHTREILEFCSSREELSSREAEIVNLNEIAKEKCMNITVGGWGGHFISKEQSSINLSNILNKLWKDNDYRNKHSLITKERNKKLHKEGILKAPNWTGKKHTEETKEKLRNIDRHGSKNSQYGTMWITNGKENKKIKKEEKIPEGWVKGRKLKLIHI